MDPTLPRPPGRPDSRTTRERLDSLERRLDAVDDRLDELTARFRVLAFTLGWDADALGFPPDEAP